MANEIALAGGLTVAKNSAQISMSGSKTVDMAGNPFISNIQIIGTTSEQLVFGDVTAPGYLFLKNLDTTNYCMVSLVSPVVSATAFCTLKAGEFLVLPTRQTTVYAIANSAPVNVQVGLSSV